MRILKNNELQTFEHLARLTQPSLRKHLNMFLRQKYDKVVTTEDYIYAEGTIPIALIAHMDTVFPIPPEEILYDTNHNIMISPQGLGADDRAGIYMITKLIRDGFKPHVIFTTDEERGCLGAAQLAKLPCPFKDLRFMIQLDRRGANDCVFYECDNPSFTEYIESFGFVEAFGSFTDITELGPAWNVGAVNLSVGYRDEHTRSEVLFVGQMLETLEKVRTILRQKIELIPEFKFIPRVWTSDPWLSKYHTDHVCKCCGKYIPNHNGITVYSDYDFDYVTYCNDCKDIALKKCSICGSYYEPYARDEFNACLDCTDDLLDRKFGRD